MAGLPKIFIDFYSKLKDKIERDPAGIVALVLQDEEVSNGFYEYKRNDTINDDWTSKNMDYIEQAFEGSPKKLIIVNAGALEEGESITDSLKKFKHQRFNYLAIPDISSSETEDVVDWVKEKRKKDRRMFKAVLPNTAADHEAIINFTAEDIEVGDNIYDTGEYTPRIAGALAGLPFNRSATYFILDEVDSIKESDDPDAAVDDGELILIDDGENIKIGRGVNSLQSTEGEKDNKNEEFKSIRVVDIMDLIHDEIHDNFEENYIGKVPNIYDNQALFVNDVNNAFQELEADDMQLLSPDHDNEVWIDVDAQRGAWENAGIDTEDWDDDEVKRKSFRRNVYLAGSIKLVDTIEDLELFIEV